MASRFSRRAFLLTGSAISTLPFVSIAAPGQGSLDFPTPDPKKLVSGDLVWPKKKSAYVPYKSGDDDATYYAERVEWQRERDEYVKARREEPSLTVEERAHVDSIANMEFREFLALYQADEAPDVPGLYSGRDGGGLYVGHVGVIELDQSGTPWVVEALWKKGVVRHTYAEWLAGRPNQLVWHGRIKNLSADHGSAIAAEAAKHVGKPYKFWNFDLNDDRGFYCSKLVWLATFRATGIAIDGMPKAKRGFWFSPKQLLYVDRMSRLHDPGNYGTV